MRDVIVVGAGGGGAIVAKELAARGLDVLVLEGGPRFADPERDWVPTDFTAFGFSNPAGRLRSGFAEATKGVARLQAEGVGGTTLLYFGNSPRAMPHVFQESGADADQFDVAHAFPFPYRDLVPYYEWVEGTLPVSTAPMDTKSEVFLRGASAIGLPLQTSKDIGGAAFRPQENAILPPRGTAGRQTVLRNRDATNAVRFPEAEGCTFCGHCILGCAEPFGAPRNLKAKRSTDNSYVPMALTADRWAGGRAAELVAHAFVTSILWESAEGGRARARGVRWRDRDTGQANSEDARVVVLAAGAFESPRLWLTSGLPDANGWVGTGYTDHFMDVLFGLFAEPVHQSRGPGSNARADFPGYGMLEVNGFPPGIGAGAATLSLGGFEGTIGQRTVGSELEFAMQSFDRVMPVAVLTDDPVDRRNRIELSQVFRDDHGAVPRIVVERRSERTRAKRDFLAEKAAEILTAAGALLTVRLDFPSVSVHPMSTLRMGEDPVDSVLDARGEARFVERLFVADNCALPNALGGVNPTLTTQALATRTAETVFQRYFGGDPWVERGDGFVSSIDDRVTDAVMAAGV